MALFALLLFCSLAASELAFKSPSLNQRYEEGDTVHVALATGPLRSDASLVLKINSEEISRISTPDPSIQLADLQSGRYFVFAYLETQDGTVVETSGRRYFTVGNPQLERPNFKDDTFFLEDVALEEEEPIVSILSPTDCQSIKSGASFDLVVAVQADLVNFEGTPPIGILFLNIHG